MKKLIISILVITLILVGTIWGYLFLFGAPDSTSDFFADLGLGGVEREFEPTETTGEFAGNTDIPEESTNDALRLLSARPVADFTVLGTSTAESRVRIVEQGTGHIFDIDITTGKESQITNTTHQGINSAKLSKDGTKVVLQAVRSNSPTATLITLSDSSSPAKDLPPDIKEVGFSDDGKELYYIRTDAKGSLAYEYTIATGESKVIFSVPFIAPAVLWGDEVIVYNRPGEGYPGYAYTLSSEKSGELERLTVGGVGLTAARIGSNVFVNKQLSDGSYSGFLVKTGEEDVSLGRIILQEKCTSSGYDPIIYCAAPRGSNRNMPFSWYKGETSLEDELWLVNVASSSSKVLGELSTSQRSIDVIKMDASPEKDIFIFVDKNTNTLWSFNLF